MSVSRLAVLSGGGWRGVLTGASAPTEVVLKSRPAARARASSSERELEAVALCTEAVAACAEAV